MKIFYLKLAAILILAYLFYGCSETTESTNAGKRYVYFFDGTAYNPDGLKFLVSHNLVTGEEKGISRSTYEYLSGISKSGAFVFPNESDFLYSWLFSSDGTRLPISIPQSQDSKMEYYVYPFPGMQICYENNRIAYFVSYTNYENSEFPWAGKPKLVLLDYPQSISKIVELDAVCKLAIQDTSINYIAPFGDNFFLSNDGTKVWFLLSAYNITGPVDWNDIANKAFYIFEYSNGQVTLKCNTLPNPIIKLLGADYLNEKIFAAKRLINDTLVIAFDKYNDSISINIPYENFSNPEQFAKEKSEMAGWTDNGIAIYDLTTMTVKQSIINWSRIDSLYPGLAHQKNKRLSISPDAEYISFALPLKYSDYNYDLFVIKRDGSEFKRILKNSSVGIPVISCVIE